MVVVEDLVKKLAIGGVPNPVRNEGCHIEADPTGETDRICYGSGHSAVVRSVSDPTDFLVFTGHTANVLCARFSPDGKEIVSGDEQGSIFGWDAKTGKVITDSAGISAGSAPIRDVCLSADKKFLLIAGDSRGAHLKVYKYPGGSSAGKCPGHQKKATAIDQVKTPSKLIAGCGEDFKISIHKGPPVSEFAVPVVLEGVHTGFVNQIRFNKDGTKLATCSSDRTVCIIDSTSHEVLKRIEDHTASVLMLAWTADGTSVVTASADKTVRVFDAESGEQKRCITIGDEVEDMQVGVTVIPKTGQIVALGLSGFLQIFDEGADKASKVLVGHSKPCVGLHGAGDSVYSADYSGTMCVWDSDKGQSERTFAGVKPTTLNAIGGGQKTIAAVGMDGNVYQADLESLVFPEPSNVKGGGREICVPGSGEGPFGCMVISEDYLTALAKDGSVVASKNLADGWGKGRSIASNADGSLVAISVEIMGGAGHIYLCKVEGGEFTPVADKIEMQTFASKMAFNAEGAILLVGESSRRVRFFSSTGELMPGGGVLHTARVDAVCWTASGKAVTGGLDGSIGVWEPGVKGDPLRKMKGAHRGGILGLACTESGFLYSTGGDNQIAVWQL
ncbi:Actin-interacting protein 1 [Porphyridium purpureum]|uniref:Actin-interacting protein 1 n=1 Tax=Porphyridium purpureum TaxID=35688 RepID=A0A5J4Z202_PORPP|nr:Actin-interacting protein 1 [Porphyridium purpureum]|eukprot:POR6369..scf295_1